MAGKVLGRGRHPRLAHPADEGDCELGHDLRVAMEGAIADDAADPVIEVDTGRETHVDAYRAQLRRHQPAALARELPPGRLVEVVFAADGDRKSTRLNSSH